ncbi:SDR family oxidoreductase [Patescibacteria group bacterium]|nr:SDR family oxidoreductase [Patescibacteria group bacterium]
MRTFHCRVENIKKNYDHIDLHINNACGWYKGGIKVTPFNEIKKQIDSSITGNILITKEMIPLLLRASGPQVVNICSMVGTGYRFSPNTLYTILKGALEAFGRSLRNDLKDENIRVINIHLGQLEDDEPIENPRIPLSDVVKVMELIVSVSSNTSIDSICLTPAKYYY